MLLRVASWSLVAEGGPALPCPVTAAIPTSRVRGFCVLPLWLPPRQGASNSVGGASNSGGAPSPTRAPLARRLPASPRDLRLGCLVTCAVAGAAAVLEEHVEAGHCPSELAMSMASCSAPRCSFSGWHGAGETRQTLYQTTRCEFLLGAWRGTIRNHSKRQAGRDRSRDDRCT